MPERRILIVDHDHKNLKILEEYFRESKFIVDTATNDLEALECINRSSYHVVLSELNCPGIDGFQLLKEIQRNSVRNGIIVIFLSPKSDVWNRVKSLKLGAKDYIVKPVHVREIVSRVKMVVQRASVERLQRRDENHQFSGRLEDLSVIDLIEIFGIEKKTGLLVLYNENGHNGQIAFKHGNVFGAMTVSLRAEEAVYKMMNWNRGRFTMFFGDVDVEDEMILSNMGILLQGAKRMDLRNELLKQLPSLDAVVITTANFKKILSQKEMNQELKEFLTLFDGERTLGRIIDDCRENEIVALKRIVKLYKLGFLHVLRDFTREQSPMEFKLHQDSEFISENDFDEDESFENEEQDIEMLAVKPTAGPKNGFKTKTVEENVLLSQEMKVNQPTLPSIEVKEETIIPGLPSVPQYQMEPEQTSLAKQIGVVLILGSNEDRQRRFIESLTLQSIVQIKNRQFNLPHGHLKFRNGNYLTLISVTVDQEFSSILDYFKTLVLGYILLIDEKMSNWSYYRYLLNVLRRKSQASFQAVYTAEKINDFELQNIRALLNLRDDENLQLFPSMEAMRARQLLFSVLQGRIEELDIVENESAKVGQNK